MSRVKEYDPDEALEKAMHTFWIKGYRSTSMQDLVEGMGINRFSIYDSFGSKRQLFLAVLDKYCERVMEKRMKALEQSTEGLSCLSAFFQDYADGVRENIARKGLPKGCLMTMTSLDPISGDPEAAKRTQANFRRMAKAFRKVLERAVEKKELRSGSDLDACAIFLVGCTQGLDIIAKTLSHKELRQFIDVVLAGLK